MTRHNEKKEGNFPKVLSKHTETKKGIDISHVSRL